MDSGKMQLVDSTLSQNFLIVNKTLTKNIGYRQSHILALLIDKRRYWTQQGKLQEDGSFFKKLDELSEELGTGLKDVRSGISVLEDLGILTIKRIGLPARNYYLLNDELILKNLESEDLDLPERNHWICRKGRSGSAGKEDLDLPERKPTNNPIQRTQNKEHNTNMYINLRPESEAPLVDSSSDTLDMLNAISPADISKNSSTPQSVEQTLSKITPASVISTESALRASPSMESHNGGLPSSTGRNKKKSSKWKFDQEDLAFAHEWADYAKEVIPTIGIDIEQWANEVRLTRKRFGVSIPTLRHLLAFIRENPFWRPNAVSIMGLAKQGKNGLRKYENIANSFRQSSSDYQFNDMVERMIEQGEF